MLLHYGPKDYNDPAEVAKYILPAGGEEENCIIAHTPNTTEVHTKGYNGRMRPNSHHLIVTTLKDDVPDSDGPIPARSEPRWARAGCSVHRIRRSTSR